MTPPAWLGAFGLLIFLGIILGYLAFSVASLRTTALSRTTGLALLTPLLVMAMNISIVQLGYSSPEGQFAVSSGFALAHLAIGGALRTEEVPSERAESASEATA